MTEELLNLLGYGKVISDIETTEAYNMDCLSFRTERYTDDGRGANKKVRISEHFIISVHELAHKCKEWVRDNNTNKVELFSGLDFCCIRYGQVTAQRFDADTEPQAIFKACLWLLENKEK